MTEAAESTAAEPEPKTTSTDEPAASTPSDEEETPPAGTPKRRGRLVFFTSRTDATGRAESSVVPAASVPNRHGTAIRLRPFGTDGALGRQ